MAKIIAAPVFMQLFQKFNPKAHSGYCENVIIYEKKKMNSNVFIRITQINIEKIQFNSSVGFN